MLEARAHSFFFFSVGIEPRAFCIFSKYSLSCLSGLCTRLYPSFTSASLPVFMATVLPAGAGRSTASMFILSFPLVLPLILSHVSHLNLLCGQSLATATYFITNFPATLP